MEAQDTGLQNQSGGGTQQDLAKGWLGRGRGSAEDTTRLEAGPDGGRTKAKAGPITGKTRSGAEPLLGGGSNWTGPD